MITNFGSRAAGDGDLVTGGTALSVSAIKDSPIDCLGTATGNRYNSGQQIKGRSGWRWTDGQAEKIGFTTVLAPNSPSCIQNGNTNGDANDTLMPPTSNHPGGCMTLRADGSVHFVTDTIDTGDLSQPGLRAGNGRSPYGVWGALGSKAGGEVVSD